VDIVVRTCTLRRAAEIVGDRAQLRKCLNVSAICLAAWMAGLDAAPNEVFLKAVDIIMDNRADDADRNL